MKAITANLKTLYQCPAIWFWHLLGTWLCLPLIIRPLAYPEAGKGYFCGFLPVAFWLGVIIASLTKDILVKPFVFCLPGQVKTARKYLFLSGAAISGVSALTLLAFPGITTGQTLAAIVTVFTLGLALYSLTVLAIMAVRNFGPVPLVYLVFLYAMYDVQSENFRAGLERFIIDHPVACTAPSLAVLVMAWNILGKRSLARKLCTRSFLPIYSIFNAAKVGRFHEEEKNRRFMGKPSPMMNAVAEFTLARMKGRGRHIWGSFYNIAGSMTPVNPVNFFILVLLILAGTAALGYYIPQKHPTHISVANLVLLAPVSGIGNGMQFNLFSTLLLPVSRREKFWTILSTYLAGLAACVLLSLPIIAASKAFGQFAPQLSLSGETISYLPIDVKSMFYMLLLVPFLFCCQILFPRFFTISAIILTIAFLITYMETVEGFMAMSPAGIALLYLICSLPFISLARYHACSRDLVLRGQ